MTDFDVSSLVKEQPCEVATDKKRISLGLPAAIGHERRFPLTPEAVAILTDKGVSVRIESGASAPIHYSDVSYAQSGAEIVARKEALNCDIILSLSPLTAADVMCMRRGCMLLTLFDSVNGNPDYVRGLLDRSVICIALDQFEDEDGNTPFADVLHEIDGRAAITLAAAMQADSYNGKGILMGGVAGIVPCEVTVLGSGIAACAAAKSAMGLGATVRMFDNDVYSLRKAVRHLGDGVISSAIHPHVLEGALRSADVIVSTDMKMPCEIDSAMEALMKKRVLVFDLSWRRKSAFISMSAVDMAEWHGAESQSAGGSQRVCYCNVGSCVPRTAAMAIGNAFVTLTDEILTCGDCSTMHNVLRLQSGLQSAVLTFMGKPIHREIAVSVGMRNVDLSLFLTLS